MENYKRISTGDVKMPFITSMFNDMLSLLRSKIIMVPAKWSVEEVLFDFKNRFATSFDPKMPEANFTEAVGLMIDMWEAAKWSAAVQDESSKDSKKKGSATKKKGFDAATTSKIASLLGVEESQVEYLGNQLEYSFARTLAGSMVTPTLVRTLLSDHRYHTKEFPKIDTAVSFRLREMLIHLHTLFAESAPWAEIQNYVQSTVANDSVVEAAHQLILTFRSPEGMTVPLRLDYVIDTVFDDIDRDRFYKSQALAAQQLLREVTEITIPDLGFKELISFYFSYLRRFMGGPKDQGVSFTYSYLSQVIAKSRPIWPVLPDEALDSVDRVEELFDRLAILNMVQDAALGQFGGLRSTFATFISDKKYRNDDTYFQFVNKWLDALCLAANACDNAANWIYLKSMAPEIYYKDLDTWSLTKIKEYVQSVITALSSLSLATDHPRYLLQPALLINQSKASAYQIVGDNFGMNTSVTPSFFFEDDEYSKLNTYVVNPTTFTYVSYRKSPHLGGMLFSAPIGGLDRRVMFPPLCSDITPSYFRTFPLSSDFTSLPAIDFRMRHFPVKSITNKGWFHLLRNSVNINVFTDFQDFAQTAHIPYALAEELFPGPDVPFASFEGPLLEYFIWSAELAPLYELNDKDTEEGRYKPFIATYPFLVANEEVGVNIGYSAEGFMSQYAPSIPKPGGSNRKSAEQLAAEVREEQPTPAINDLEDKNPEKQRAEAMSAITDDSK